MERTLYANKQYRLCIISSHYYTIFDIFVVVVVAGIANTWDIHFDSDGIGDDFLFCSQSLRENIWKAMGKGEEVLNVLSAYEKNVTKRYTYIRLGYSLPTELSDNKYSPQNNTRRASFIRSYPIYPPKGRIREWSGAQKKRKKKNVCSPGQPENG